MTIPRDTKRVIALEEHLHSHLPADAALRVKALESLLVEKGLVNSATIDRWIEVFSEAVGPKNGARVVARAWTDPAFKQRLLTNGTAAIVELGCPKIEANHLVVVENTPQRGTTSSSAPCVPATRGRCWACRRPGTNLLNIAHEWSAILATS